MIVRAFQDLALALIIARRHGVLDLVGAYFRDDLLTGRDEPDQLAIDLGQTFAQFFKRHEYLVRAVCTLGGVTVQG